MPNSTTTIQSIFDFIASAGEVNPIIPAGGFSTNTATTIASDVMKDMIAARFNWKFNRAKSPLFVTNSWERDYAIIGQDDIGWIEDAYWVDTNNTAKPKPRWTIEVKRELATDAIQGNPPAKICWQYNNQLDQGIWPGADQLYVQPIGTNLPSSPNNPPINILDANGNILVLTTYGTTGSTAPAAPADSDEGVKVNDGSCVWTVADPEGQGFRLWPIPPQQGVVYQIHVIKQLKAPPDFTSMDQLINPIPDEYANYFRTGCITHCYRVSPNPRMQSMFPTQRESWLASMPQAQKQADREQQDAGFIPDRSVVAPSGTYDIGPANPYLYPTWPGR